MHVWLSLGIACVLGCSSPAGVDGERGDPGPAGPTGPAGAKGDTGATGPAGPSGTTGQDIFEVYGNAQLQVSSATAVFTAIPGLTETVSIPAGAKVHVQTNGGIQCTQAGTAFSVVDIALFVDGNISTLGGQRRVVAANSAAVGQMIATWSFGRSYVLTAGAHQFEVRAIGVDPAAAIANVSSGTAQQLQGVLTVTVVNQ